MIVAASRFARSPSSNRSTMVALASFRPSARIVFRRRLSSSRLQLVSRSQTFRLGRSSASVWACSLCCNASVAAYGPDSDLGVFGRLELSNSVHSMYSESLHETLLRERGRIGDHHSTVRVRVTRFDRALCASAPGSASVHRVSPWAPRSNGGPPSRSRCLAAAEHLRGVLTWVL